MEHCAFHVHYPIPSSLQLYGVGPIFLLKIDDEVSSQWLSHLLEVTRLVGSRTGIHPNSLQF